MISSRILFELLETRQCNIVSVMSNELFLVTVVQLTLRQLCMCLYICMCLDTILKPKEI